MSEEERKAIEFMFFYKEHCLNIEKKNIKNYETVNDEEFVYKNINAVLNLIEKQQKEIEEEKEANNETICQLIDEKEKLEEENRIFALQRDYYKARYNEFNEAFIKMKS